MKKLIFMILLVGLTSLFSNVSLAEVAKRPATDAEQKASYCLAITKLNQSVFLATLKNQPKDLTPELKKSLEESVVDLNDQINRLQSFLSPTVKYVEPEAILAAYSRGEKDFKKREESKLIEDCTQQCISKTSHEKPERCLFNCLNADPLHRRTYECNKLDFLPY